MQREPGGCTVYVRVDGQIFLDDILVAPEALTQTLSDRLDDDATLQVVVAADATVPYGRVQEVLDLARAAKPRNLALEVDAATASGMVPPDAQELGTLSQDELRDLRPRRYRFPQNPYANTSGFTAYSLELGEFRVGLGTLAAGVLPGTQVGTFLPGDLAGAFNIYGKSNIVRRGPLDLALIAQYYKVPSWLLDLATDQANAALDGGGQTGSLRASGGYLGLGAVVSLQILDPWSAHLSVYYGRPGAKGSFAFDDLPALLFPGLDVPETDGNLVARVNGDAVVINLATDLRFNRRDSVFVWGRVPVYARARGLASAEDFGEGFDGIDIIVAYGQPLPPSETYSVAFGYMASWKHFEARVGLGVDAYPVPVWALQAFDLSYRFGGPTRRSEGDIRRGYRDQRRDLRDQPPVSAPPVGPTPAE